MTRGFYDLGLTLDRIFPLCCVQTSPVMLDQSSYSSKLYEYTVRPDLWIEYRRTNRRPVGSGRPAIRNAEVLRQRLAVRRHGDGLLQLPIRSELEHSGDLTEREGERRDTQYQLCVGSQRREVLATKSSSFLNVTANAHRQVIRSVYNPDP